jgi:uncharacterized protein (DUF58 family)
MLTRTGIAVLVGSIVTVVGGRLFGLVELYVVGAAGLLIVLLAVIYVSLRRLDIKVRRELSPPRVYAGSPGRVELRLENRSSLRSPVMRLEDSVTGTQGVDLQVPPIHQDAETVAVYRLPTDRRGAVVVGPLHLTVFDPFGLARITVTAERQMTLIVYPKILAVRAPSRSSGTTPDFGISQRGRVAVIGDEFAGLRPYELGDDLRRVHWRMSARHDELVVRQEEAPWLGQLTVALDTRLETTSTVDFEDMVTAAASILVAASRRGDQLRLVTSGGYDSEAGTGNEHIQRMLEHLALLEATSHTLGPMVDRLKVAGGGGSIVAIVARSPGHEALPLAQLGTHFARPTTLAFRGPGIEAPAVTGGRRAVLVDVGPGTSFVEAWQHASGPRAPHLLTEARP